QEEDERLDELIPGASSAPAPTTSWLGQVAFRRGLDYSSVSAPPTRPSSTRPDTPWITRPPTPDEPAKPESPEPGPQDTAKPVVMATNTSMPSWGGKVGEELTSKNFLKRAEGWLIQTQKSESDYTKLVRLFYKDGSRAEKWHEELAKGEKEKGWDHYSELLLKEFPARATVTKKTSDYIQELHAMQLETEGLDVKNKEKNQWPHQKFADDLWELSVAAGISNTPSDIYSIHKQLPTIFHTLVSNDAENWKEFTDELRKVDIKVVKEKLGTAKAIEELKEKQTTMQAPGTPSTRLANSLSNVRIGQAPAQQRYGNQGSRTPAADPFASNAGGRGNLFQGTQYRQPQQQITYQQPQQNPLYQQPLQRTQLTDAQKETLKANVNRYEQKSDTPEGKALWRQDLLTFTNQWGRAAPNENMVWPIAPGTQRPGTGECFGCAGPSHGRNVQCQATTSIGEQERNYRRFMQRAVGAFQRTMTTNTYAVGVGNDIEWMLAGYTDSGNGEGSTD
ncbi:hypothetical protein PQX77_014722, partial [Marasmius sp. AFHP31]